VVTFSALDQNMTTVGMRFSCLQHDLF